VTLLDQNNLVLPASIIQILKAGWNKHVPLTSLTNCVCRTATLAATHTLKSGFTLGTDSCLIVKSSLLDFTKEDTIDLIEWFETSRHLVIMISKHLFAQGDPAPGGPAAKSILKIIHRHFATIQQKADFELNFSCYREYDIIW
jgi:hypothetical protein